MTKVAINGLGRIGRAALKIILDSPQLDVVAVNDIVPMKNIVYLLKYDSVYGRYEKTVEEDGENLIIAGKSYRYYNEKDPAHLPWSRLGVDIVLECTGVFTKKEDLEKHIQAGARYVAANFVPTSTGAALATSKALPELSGLFDGIAVRGPVAVGSLADIVLVAERKTSVEEINQIFVEEAASDRYRDKYVPHANYRQED